MFFFKACPKCHGDLYEDSDGYGAFLECLQCGLLRDVDCNEIGVRNPRNDQVSARPPAHPYSLRLSA